MSEELKRTKEALEVAVCTVKEFRNGLLPHHAAAIEEKINEINAILHPEPEYEEVEVVRWLCPECGRCYTGEGSPDSGVCCDSRLVKLTGTLRRQKVKVERSVTVEGININDVGQIRYVNRPLLFFKGAEGKTVTLTATWTE